jgi:hypothetical protein
MRLAQGRAAAVVAFAAAAFAVLSALAGWPAAGSGPGAPGPIALEVSATAVSLPEGDPSKGRFGALRFVGGLALASPDPRFGGLSDLRVSEDGRRLLAVSDCGYGFSAELESDVEGRPSGLRRARYVELQGPGGRALLAGEADAESLVRDGDRLEVGYEGRDRVWSYSAEPPFGLPVEPLDAPAGIRRCAANSGIEAMTGLASAGRLMACEGEKRPSRTVPAWTGRPGAWVARSYPLHFEGGWAGQPFRPTGAATLPRGDVLVVERRFPPFGVRVVRLSRENLEGTAHLAPEPIASFEGFALPANYEGIDIRRDDAGRTLVYLISDDNGCAKAGATRTRFLPTNLLVFELVE